MATQPSLGDQRASSIVHPADSPLPRRKDNWVQISSFSLTCLFYTIVLLHHHTISYKHNNTQTLVIFDKLVDGEGELA